MASYKKITKNIERVIIDNPGTKDGKLIWLKVNNAGKTEIEYLRKEYNFSLAHLQASSAKIFAQRPRVDITEDYIFLILHFPIFRDGDIVAGEIDFFIKRGLLITLQNDNLKTLNDFFSYCKKDQGSLLSYKFESVAILLYELLEKLMNSCYELLDRNDLEISKVEDGIFGRHRKKVVSQILDLRRNIINYRRIMQNHKNIIKKLMEMESRIVPAHEMKKHYYLLIEHTKRIWEYLENHKEMIEVLNDTNESLTNYRLNDIMKTLTIFSVLVFPLTLLAAIFGMNTTGSMPFIDSANGFWMVISIMMAGCLGMLLFFKKKKWL